MARAFACSTTCRQVIARTLDEIGGDVDFIQGSVADEDAAERRRSKASNWSFTKQQFLQCRVRLKRHARLTSHQLTERFLCSLRRETKA